MKKGKKRLLLGWICLLLSLCMVTVASAETDGTPSQPCHQVTMTEQKSTAQNGASISVTRQGAAPSIPRAEEVDAMLRRA